MFKFSIKGLLPLSLACLLFSMKGACAQPAVIGMIGGGHSKLKSPYLGWVYPDGSVQTVVDPFISIPTLALSIAMNDQGMALIGGMSTTQDSPPKLLPYGKLIGLDGTVIPLTLPSFTEGAAIRRVALNNEGYGLVGGFSGNPSTVNTFPYGGVVTPDGTVNAFSGSALPRGIGEIQSVAIDSFGYGIIGGRHQNRNMYVAKVAPNGDTSELQSSFKINQTIGNITSVAMNRAGQGVIGGFFGDKTVGQFYAATVDCRLSGKSDSSPLFCLSI